MSFNELLEGMAGMIEKLPINTQCHKAGSANQRLKQNQIRVNIESDQCKEIKFLIIFPKRFTYLELVSD